MLVCSTDVHPNTQKDVLHNASLCPVVNLVASQTTTKNVRSSPI